MNEREWVCAYVFMCVYVYVCVWERDRKRDYVNVYRIRFKNYFQQLVITVGIKFEKANKTFYK